jgi:nicotinamide-nucleotide amidase
MRAEIISVGTELLLGDLVDTNAVTISKKLNGIGIDVYYRTTVGDNERRIAEVVSHALKRVDVVIVNGGLGPTVDDVTREGIAQATGCELVFHQHLLDAIVTRFEEYGVDMTNNNRRQAHIPMGGVPIINAVGTAPIFVLATDEGIVMTLPGVPHEMEYLLEEHLLPWLRTYDERGMVLMTRILRTAGIGESMLDERIGDLMRMANPTVALTAKAGQTDIRITAKASSEEEAMQRIKPIEDDLRARLGHIIYGVDGEAIEQVVSQLAEEAGVSIAVLEAGTSGILEARLGVNGDVLVSIADLSHFDITTNAPLEDVALKAAQTIRSRKSSDYGIALLQDSGEGAYAVVGEGYAQSRGFNWRREDTRIWSSTWALAMMRHALLSVSST